MHAGARDIPPLERAAHEAAVRNAADAGWAVLLAGGESFEAVAAALASFEDDPAVNAGRGGALTREGHVELEAGLMDGRRLRVGAVAGVRRLARPSEAARALLGAPFVLLHGGGAEAFARESGLALVAPESLVVEGERTRLARWRERGGAAAGPLATDPADTVGAVALDRDGGIAAGTSTGGLVGKPSGRIGDAAIAGAGFFADHLAAGAAVSGGGEAIVRHATARRAVELAREGNNAVDACWLAMRELEDRWSGHGGLVLIGRDGTIGYAFDTPTMAIAWRDDEVPNTVLVGFARRGGP